jgi:hypothetical protein
VGGFAALTESHGKDGKPRTGAALVNERRVFVCCLAVGEGVK